MRRLIDAFIRSPVRPSEFVADAIRILAVVSVFVAGFGWGPAQAGLFMLALLGTLIPRALAVRPFLDILTGVVVLIAAWSNIFHLYTELTGWDKVVHVVLTAVIASLIVIGAQQTGLLPSPRRHRAGLIFATLAAGLAAGCLWEMLEWGGHNLIDSTIFVGYDDTIGDLAADGVGALAAGFALPFLAAQ